MDETERREYYAKNQKKLSNVKDFKSNTDEHFPNSSSVNPLLSTANQNVSDGRATVSQGVTNNFPTVSLPPQIFGSSQNQPSLMNVQSMMSPESRLIASPVNFPFPNNYEESSAKASVVENNMLYRNSTVSPHQIFESPALQKSNMTDASYMGSRKEPMNHTINHAVRRPRFELETNCMRINEGHTPPSNIYSPETDNSSPKKYRSSMPADQQCFLDYSQTRYNPDYNGSLSPVNYNSSPNNPLGTRMETEENDLKYLFNPNKCVVPPTNYKYPIVQNPILQTMSPNNPIVQTTETSIGKVVPGIFQAPRQFNCASEMYPDNQTMNRGYRKISNGQQMSFERKDSLKCLTGDEVEDVLNCLSMH